MIQFAGRMWNSSEFMRTFKQHSTMSFNGRRDRLSQRPTELLLALCLRLLPCQSPIKIQKSKNDSSNVRKGRSRGGVMRQVMLTYPLNHDIWYNLNMKVILSIALLALSLTAGRCVAAASWFSVANHDWGEGGLSIYYYGNMTPEIGFTATYNTLGNISKLTPNVSYVNCGNSCAYWVRAYAENESSR